MARDKRKSQQAERRRVVKKKVSILSSENIDWVDYKDVNLLRRFMSERAKIRARRVTGNSAQQQRAVARAIRIAREMALLPYSVRQVTQRGRGGRRDRDRDRMPEAESELDAPEAEGAPGEAGADGEAAIDAEVEPQEEAAEPAADGEAQP
jgi:small subunit ribosomal protein S18